MPETQNRTLFVIHSAEALDYADKLVTTPGTHLHEGRWKNVHLTNQARRKIMKKGNLIEWWEHHLRRRIEEDPGPIHKLR